MAPESKKLSNITGLLQYHFMLNLIVFTSFTTKTTTYTCIQIPHLLLQVVPLGTTLKYCLPGLNIIWTRIFFNNLHLFNVSYKRWWFRYVFPTKIPHFIQL